MTEFEKLDKYVTEKNIPVTSVCRSLGFSSGLYNQWRSGTQNPSERKLIAFAKACGISLDYLFSNNFTQQTSSDLDEIEQAVVDKLREMPPAEKVKKAALILE